jgi:hypothetical protein
MPAETCELPTLADVARRGMSQYNRISTHRPLEFAAFVRQRGRNTPLRGALIKSPTVSAELVRDACEGRNSVQAYPALAHKVSVNARAKSVSMDARTPRATSRIINER